MILTADGGSTKCDWALADDEDVRYLSTRGLNPFACDDETIARILDSELLPCLDATRIEAVYFYGAGCIFDGAERTARALCARFAGAHIEVESDMAGAARALYGNGSGIAAILGTGSNSCLYDGRRIVHNVPPLGYILGDEGSGANIGRTVVADILKGLAGDRVREMLYQECGTSYARIIEHVYRRPEANRYLAGFARFAARHLDLPPIRAAVERSFDAFVERNLMQYPVGEYPIGFVGSIAHFFREPLTSALARRSLSPQAIMRRPIEALARYHKNMR